MVIRTFGIEEELHLVDPATGETTARSPQVLKAFRERDPSAGGDDAPRAAADELEQELFRHQLETRTDPVVDADDALAQLLAARRTAAGAARAAGAATAAAGTLPLAGTAPGSRPGTATATSSTPSARSGAPAAPAACTSTWRIDSDDEGVGGHRPDAAVAAGAARRQRELAVRRRRGQRVRLVAGPGLVALADRRAARSRSGRSQRYREVAATLQEHGAARDPGMLYFDARLSREQPDGGGPGRRRLHRPRRRGAGRAAGARASSSTAAGDWSAGAPVPELAHRACCAPPTGGRRATASRGRWCTRWSGALRPAREVLEALVTAVRPVLEATGDVERVTEGVARVLGRERGVAAAGRATNGPGTLSGVVRDLVARTETSGDAAVSLRVA